MPWRRDRLSTPIFLGFPGGSDSKESACNAGDLGSIPGLGRSPWGRAWLERNEYILLKTMCLKLCYSLKVMEQLYGVQIAYSIFRKNLLNKMWNILLFTLINDEIEVSEVHHYTLKAPETRWLQVDLTLICMSPSPVVYSLKHLLLSMYDLLKCF